ncbi:hypothetical protein FGG08_002017 [Glutinoglossum americanum]|uniref:Uncharacterized protein n=1 Tax=Glutinoglossum americanum TaxID=1670608 RepID=A0A9P8IFX4_9PEZI|nr:hypothetical protein FGG08_002017 [Glutinoglossum americanum]
MLRNERQTHSGRDFGQRLYGHTMAQKSLFFSLPIELRLLVYKEVLLAKPCRDLQILRVCRDIYNEALPVLFKKPLKFRTHDDLYHWIQTVEPDCLELVTSVSLNLLSFRYNTLSRPNHYPLHSPDLFYGKDLPSLQNALRLLPNVQRFIIYKSVPFLGTRFTYDYYLLFFPWLADRYPELRCLTLFINWMPLDFLLQMRFLRSLRFTGFSTSSPTATLIIFQSLKHLEELEVFGPPPDIPRPALSLAYTGLGVSHEKSVTPELLLGIGPLKAFTICEIRDPCKTSGVFFCEEIIDALAQTHGSSLRSLKISLDFLPSAGGRAALARLFSLANTSIRHVELGWPGLDVLTLDTLPHTLRSLQISCDYHFPPDDAAQKLVAQKPVLPKLADVVLRSDWRTRPTGWPGGGIPARGRGFGKDNMDAAVARLRSIGLDATSGWWHPIMFDDLGDDHDDGRPAQRAFGVNKESQEAKAGQSVNSLLTQKSIASLPFQGPGGSGTASYY